MAAAVAVAVAAAGGGRPLDLVAFLASADLAHHAERLRAEDIESLDDLALLNREDIEACGIPAADAAQIEDAVAALRLGATGGGTGGGRSGGGATGTGPFVPRRSSELASFLASERPVSPEDATEFSRYLPRGDPTAAQQQLGRAGEALAAAYLRGAAERGELAGSIGPGSWLVIWRNMGEERGEPWDILLKGSSGRRLGRGQDDHGRRRAQAHGGLPESPRLRAGASRIVLYPARLRGTRRRLLRGAPRRSLRTRRGGHRDQGHRCCSRCEVCLLGGIITESTHTHIRAQSATPSRTRGAPATRDRP